MLCQVLPQVTGLHSLLQQVRQFLLKQFISFITPLIRLFFTNIEPASMPVAEPSRFPMTAPTIEPSDRPSVMSSAVPVYVPSSLPSARSRAVPTAVPTHTATTTPTYIPSAIRSDAPHSALTKAPHSAPTNFQAVKILGLQNRSIHTRDGLRLTVAAGEAALCVGPMSINRNFTWTVALEGTLQDTYTYQSSDSAVFLLAGYSLLPQRVYTIQVTMIDSTLHTSSTTRIVVYVQQGDLHAVISGGNEQIIRSGAILTLDASTSTDEDLSGPTGTAAGLLYSWKCIDGACPAAVGSTTSQTLNVLASSALEGTKSRWQVSVVKGVRTNTTTVLLTVAPTSAPLVTIDGPGPSVRFNVLDKLVLYGRVEALLSCTALWQMNGSSAALANIALSPLSTWIAAGPPQSFALVLARNSLPEGGGCFAQLWPQLWRFVRLFSHVVHQCTPTAWYLHCHS